MKTIRFALWVPLLLMVVAARAASLDHGVAVTDPAVLQSVDSPLALAARFGAGLGTAPGARERDSAGALFALPAMAPVRAALDRDVASYLARQQRGEIGAGLAPFDIAALYSGQTWFELAAIVNRMDRAYVAPDTCGEIRLIYRPVTEGGAEGLTRLPVTINLILNAKSPASSESCADIAKRWQALDGLSGADAVAALQAKGGILNDMMSAPVSLLEFNVQIARAPANPNDLEGKADYLMKVFRYDPASARFAESTLENEIDRVRLTTDAALAADLKSWLLAPGHLNALDAGTILLPERFLATSVINHIPAHPDGEDFARSLVPDGDVVTALARASASAPLENIRSPAGFARRLDDVSCGGCHHTRAIGGFHLPGAERPGMAKGAVVAAASPHFFGDQERRRDVVAAFADARTPDLSRGFSARPQQRRATTLTGTTFLNGWGAVCHPPSGAKVDASFANWTCAEGLVCQAVAEPPLPQAGFCFPKEN